MSLNRKEADGSTTLVAGIPFVTKENIGLGKVENKSPEELVAMSMEAGGYVTPEMFGAVGDGVTDDYDAFFDMLHYANSSKIKTVFIPKGKYVISDTIFIPDGVTICGCGEDSEIYYNGTYGFYGPGISNGGSNVTIKNLKINHLETAEVIVKRSMLGGIGFGTAMFEDWTDKHQEKRMRSHAVKNLVAYNLFSDNNYILQTETGIDNIENVTYEKIHAPISKVAFMSTNGARIDNVVVRDVTASLVGPLGVTGDFAIFENVRCNNLHLGGFDYSIVSNCEIDTDKNYNLEDGFYSESLFLGSAEIHMNNVNFKGNNPKYTTYMLLGSSTVYMNNVTCESNTYNFSIKDHNPTDGNLYCSNCDFTGTYINVLHGMCVNSKGNFPINIETFINNSNDTRKIYRSEWIVDESTWNSNVAAPINLPAGKYVLCVHLPRITYAKSSEGEDVELLIDFRNVEQNFNPPRIARNLGEIVSVIDLSASQCVAPRALGTGATFSETEKGGFTALKIQ